MKCDVWNCVMCVMSVCVYVMRVCVCVTCVCDMCVCVMCDVRCVMCNEPATCNEPVMRDVHAKCDV